MSIVQNAGAGEVSLGFYDHEIEQSLRFDDGDSPILSITPAGAGNRRIWTWSAWVKLGAMSHGTDQITLFDASSSSSQQHGIVYSGQQFYVFGYTSSFTYRKMLNAVHRDPSAWYHYVVAFDTTDGTAGDRIKIYVNGTIQTSFAHSTNPSQNYDTGFNNAVAHGLGGRLYDTANYFDGYMAEINMIDGTALGPDSFGETKDGIWVPKDASGLTFGTNGFYLPFSVTQGNSAFFDGSGDSLKFTNASHYDIASDDDFTLEFFFNHTDTDGYGDFIGNYATGGPHFLVGFDNRTEKDFYFYTGNGASFLWQMSSNGGIVANKWHHVAFQRDGTVFRCYVDGVRQTGLSDPAGNTGYTLSGGNSTDFNKAYDLASMEMGSPTAADFDGFLSNVRLVIGASVYANDDNNITVPTATLTKVSGTALLALTTNVITKDSSDNNVTGSVAGNTVHRQNTPFSTIIGNDASGENNDFATTGLAFSDIVTDSPTNNWSALNPLRVNTQTQVFAEGNLKFSSSQSSTNPACVSTFAVNSGKWYWEVLVVTSANASNSVGIATTEGDLEADQYAGYQKDWAFSYQADGNKRNNNSAAGYGATFTDGDIIAVMLDLDNGNLFFRKNDTIQASGAAAYGSLSNTFTSYSIVYGGGAQIYNFGQDSSFSGNKSGYASASDDNGLGNFFFAPPSGYLALCSSNLPDITIGPGQATQADDHFNTVLYTGNGSTGQGISGVGFSPDWVWLKSRNADRSQGWFDSVRGRAKGFAVETNGADYSSATGRDLVSFDSDGFTVGNPENFGSTNTNSDSIVAWNWLAGTAASGSESGNNPAFSSSSNATAGFSIVSYTGTGSVGTVAHGCGAIPTFIIVKNRDQTDNFAVYYGDNTDYLILNTTAATADAAAWWNDTTPTDSVFTVGTDHAVNADGEKYMAHCFADINGFSQSGIFEGNNNANGTFVFTGFRPAWVLIKNYDGTYNWMLLDSVREPFNDGLVNAFLRPNLALKEATAGKVDFLSNGFKLRDNSSDTNAAASYSYLAFAESPFKFTNAR